MNLNAFKVLSGLATTLMTVAFVIGANMAAAQVVPYRPTVRPLPAQQQPPAPVQSSAPTGLVTACATFDYQGANGTRNMGMRVLTSGQQFVLQAEGNVVVVRADYPSPNIPSANAAAMFDAVRAAWTGQRAVILGINPQGQLEGVNVQLGGANQC
jgi:hypothetical protein